MIMVLNILKPNLSIDLVATVVFVSKFKWNSCHRSLLVGEISYRIDDQDEMIYRNSTGTIIARIETVTRAIAKGKKHIVCLWRIQNLV